MQKLKENLPIVIGLSIPVFMVAVIAGVIYGEQMFSSVPPPTQNFVYALGGNVVGISPYGYAPNAPADPCADEYYRVASGTIKRYPSDPKTPKDLYCKDRPKTEVPETLFFLHDVATNKSTRLSLEEAMALQIDNTPKSKDGYEYAAYLDRGTSGLFEIFGGGNYTGNERYLKNKDRYEKMDLELSSQPYSYGEVFLGWVAE